MNPVDTVPAAFRCPISKIIMKDPYIDDDGNSYEREAILEWLSMNPISPITRKPMTEDDLSPNRALKEIIDDYLKKNNKSYDDANEKTKSTGNINIFSSI
jgi:hypothetical protein